MENVCQPSHRIHQRIPNEGYRMYIDMEGMKTAQSIMIMVLEEVVYVLLFIIRYCDKSSTNLGNCFCIRNHLFRKIKNKEIVQDYRVNDFGNHFYLSGKHFYLSGSHFYLFGMHFYHSGKHFISSGSHFIRSGNHFYLSGNRFYLSGKHFYR